MEKVAILIVLAVLLVMISPVMGYEIYNMPNFNVSTVPGELIINGSIDVVHYEESTSTITKITNPNPEDIVISPSFNVIIFPLKLGFDDTINKTIIHTIATITPPDYTFSERICVGEGKFWVAIANPGRSWNSTLQPLYEGIYNFDTNSFVGTEDFWSELNQQYNFSNMTSADIIDVLYDRLLNSSYFTNDFLFICDPPVEVKQNLAIPTPIPIITLTPTTTIEPTSIPTPTSIVTPTPQEQTPTPQQSGFEAVFAIVSLLMISICLRRKK